MSEGLLAATASFLISMLGSVAAEAACRLFDFLRGKKKTRPSNSAKNNDEQV